MSLSVFQCEVARMIADPAHRRRVAADPDGTMGRLRLGTRERKRLGAFASDPGMRVNTALYRANRLAPIFNALPRTCAALGGVFGDVLKSYWASKAIDDLQFPNEAARFAISVRRRHRRQLAAHPGLDSLMALELAILELMLLPRARIRARCTRGGSPPALHPLVRAIEVDRDPAAMIAVIEGTIGLASTAGGHGGVLVDHRADPGSLVPLTVAELKCCRAVRPGTAIPRVARVWLDERGLLVSVRTERRGRED